MRKLIVCSVVGGLLVGCASAPQYPMTEIQGGIYDSCRLFQPQAKQLLLPFQTHAECYEKATGKKVDRVTGAVSN